MTARRAALQRNGGKYKPMANVSHKAKKMAARKYVCVMQILITYYAWHNVYSTNNRGSMAK